jgi:hypothetical protein
MASPPLIIVVAGAQGTLGKLVCDALLSRARLEGRDILVRGLVRKSRAPVPTGSDPRLVIEPVDYASGDDLRRVCAGAHCVVSALQGVEDVIVGVQSHLVQAAIACNVRRLIPSDYSIDFTKLPAGSNRNFDLRLQFHRAAERLIQQAKSGLELTSVYQGAFTELLGTGWVVFDYKKRRVTYFGSPDTVGQYTTWQNTAEFTAAVAVDPNPTPRSLFVAGQLLSAVEAQLIAKRVTGVDFAMKRMMSVGMLRGVIALMKIFKPGKKGETMPLWVQMQYAYCMAVDLTAPEHLDNDRYPGIQWSGVDDVVRKAFEAAEKSKAQPAGAAA